MIFAIVSVVLLFSLVALFLKDYSREWRNYQKQFRELEVEKTRVKYDLAVNTLEKNPDYQALKEEIKKAQKGYKTNCSNLGNVKDDLNKLVTENNLTDQKYKSIKANLDAARYKYEESITRQDAQLAHNKAEFERLDGEVKELTKKINDLNDATKSKNKILSDCSAQIDELTRKERALKTQVTIFDRKLKKIDPLNMSLINQLASVVRDLPVIDFSNPNYKIEQIVLEDIKDDVNFKQVPKVERCTSCHLGIASPDYKDAPQPFRTHPNLELYLGTNSPHSIEEFGCTSCHGGRGRGTSFNTTAHTPKDEKQAEQWAKKYHWHENHLWEEPMLAQQYIEAGCFKCHSGQTVLKGSEKLNLGLNLIERAGCYSCHAIQKYQGWPKPGPDLTHIASKMSKDWAYKWIEDPKSFRANTWMPAFFNQSNNSDPQSLARAYQEIHAMVNYLFAHSDAYKIDEPPNGEAAKGEELVASLGCMACHKLTNEKLTQPMTREELRRQHGPALTGLGSKTSQKWIYNWVKDPNRYHPETKMPNLRLSDQEASDVAVYLSGNQNDHFDQKNVPAVNEQIVSNIAFDFMKKIESPSVSKQKIAVMDLDQKLQYSGEKLIGRYGCYACHNIKGFENTKPIGTELTEEGSKSVERLDFGFIHIPHTKQAWFEEKLKNPRIFDKDKIKNPDEKLMMPNFNLPEDEVEAIVTALMGFVKETSVSAKIKPRTPENFSLENGEKIVRQFNCQGCHTIGNEGGNIMENIKDWLVKYDNRSADEAASVIKTFSPPNLHGEGQKVESQWLFNFLHKPAVIRPWLKTRMPTYSFNVNHLNTLIKYFSSLDKEDFPFVDKEDTSLTPEELTTAKKLFSKDYFSCAQCHVVGNKSPSSPQDSWAPNLALAKTRLKPGWILKWIKNPSVIQPGTKMPTFFDPSNFDKSGPEDVLNGDENAQIRVLRNYLMTISDDGSDGLSEPSQPQTPQIAPAETTPQPDKADLTGGETTQPAIPAETKSMK